MSTGILSKRICLITGSSRGIGLGVARVFAENGASVILHGRDENVLRQSLAELPEPQKHRYITADINTPEGMDYFEQNDLLEKKCFQCVRTAAEILEELI